MSESATQAFLEVQDIREGVLLLKNNEIRGILMVSSINFALKSEEEQTAIVYAFQNFLNSLDFFCQIVIQSRNINITPYLDSLKDLEVKQTNQLLKELRKDSVNIDLFIDEHEIIKERIKNKGSPF